MGTIEGLLRDYCGTVMGPIAFVGPGLLAFWCFCVGGVHFLRRSWGALG